MTVCLFVHCRRSAVVVQLATVVASSGAVPHLVAAVKHSDPKLKRQACNALAQVAKHTVELAEIVVEAGLFPAYVALLR